MIFFGENSSGGFKLPEAVRIEINSEFGVPADDMTVSFLGGVPLSLHKLYAVSDGYLSLERAESDGGVIFEGIVDETVLRRDDRGTGITVYSRSPAALVLDSECEAGDYTDPTIDVMFEKHLAQFGIKQSGELYDKRTGGVMTVAKGQSHWAAVKKYCGVFLGAVPRIGFNGEFRTDTFTDEAPIVFGGNGGVGISSSSVKISRYGRISRIYVETGGEKIVLNNESARAEGIIRERRLSLSDSRTGTLSDADSIIKKGESKALSAMIVCTGFLGDAVGRSAKADIAELEGRELYVYRTKYVEDAFGGKTSVVLCAKEE